MQLPAQRGLSPPRAQVLGPASPRPAGSPEHRVLTRCVASPPRPHPLPARPVLFLSAPAPSPPRTLVPWPHPRRARPLRADRPRPLGPFPLQTPSLPPSATASSLCPSVFTFPTCVLPRAMALFRSAPAFEKRRPFPWTCPLYQWSPLCPFATRHFVPPPRSLAPRATPRRLGRRPRATSQLRAPRPRDPEFTAAFDARRIQTCSPRARSPPLMAAPHL